MDEVKVDEHVEKEYVVDQSKSTPIRGTPELKVLSTPSLVEAIEYTCKALIDRHLDEEEQSVGVMVNLRHLAPTPLGRKFKVTARLLRIDRGTCSFQVEAFDEIEKIGEGTHDRYIVKLDRFRPRIIKKS